MLGIEKFNHLVKVYPNKNITIWEIIDWLKHNIGRDGFDYSFDLNYVGNLDQTVMFSIWFKNLEDAVNFKLSNGYIYDHQCNYDQG